MKFVILSFIFMVQVFALDLNFTSFSSDFTQEVVSKDSKLTYKGNFIITQDQAFWSYQSPTQKEIYIDKKDIVIIEHDLEQVIFSKLENIPNLNEIFKNAKQTQKGQYKARYENIDYFLKLENDEIKSVSYKDDFDNEVAIYFFKQVKNTKIDPKIFIPQIPSHYDKMR